MKPDRAFVLGIACILALDAYQFTFGYMLRLPGELFFLVEIPAILALGLVPFVIAVRSLLPVIKALVRKAHFPKRELLTFLGLTAALFLPLLVGGSFHNIGVKTRIRAAGEPAYMSLAQNIRATLQKDPSLSKSSDRLTIGETFEERERWKLEFLKAILPEESPAAAQWPRSMLHVTVEETHIRIARGSGTLGLLGVVILDQTDKIEMHSPEALVENPYLPRYTKVTDRIYMFESD
jgi:hypothetical protein